MARTDDEFDTKRYRHHLPPKQEAKREQLAEDLAARGCLCPLVVAKIDGVRYLLDGFHRYDICRAGDIAFRVKDLTLPDHDAALAWIEANAEDTRFTRTSRLYYVGCRYLREKGNHGGDRKSSHQGEDLKTAERIAKEERLGRATVERAARMAAHVNDACKRGLAFLKWPLLQERLRYSKKMLAP